MSFIHLISFKKTPMNTLQIVAKTDHVLVCEDVECGKTYTLPKPSNVDIPIGMRINILISIILPTDQYVVNHVDDVIDIKNEVVLDESSSISLDELKEQWGYKLKKGGIIKVRSENDEKLLYEVTRINGKKMKCSCPAFHYRPECNCKHIRATLGIK